MAEPPYPVTGQKLTCMECLRPWTAASERWRVYLTRDDPPKLLVYCQDCAEREFDD